MSNEDRAPLIRLEIDQEVFIDTVRESDVIEDATVATEVTSFDRVGDAYVLEGALVFAGYVKSSGQDEEEAFPPAGTDALNFSVDTDGFVRHIHQRLPFVLRVPGHAQPRGIVNVASRISSWSLNVTGAGWVQVVADLSIVGLVGDKGYHFECGSQEEGNLFFGDSSGADQPAYAQQPAKPTKDDETAVADQVPSETESFAAFTPDVEVDLQLTSAEDSQPSEDAKPGEVEAISFARGGFQDESNPSNETEVRTDLAALDRALKGDSSDQDNTNDASNSVVIRPQFEEEYSTDAKVSEFSEEIGKPIAEFEFVHQVPASELKHPIPQDFRGEENFVASRSFSEEGFKPGEGFASTSDAWSVNGDDNQRLAQANEGLSEVQLGSVSSHEDDADLQEVNDAGEQDASGAEVTIRGEGATDDTGKLWSFVDFHAPEKYYTMRFIVVMEEESIESVADRIGCTRSDLVRVNRLVGDNIYAGQTLLVPNYKMNWSR